MIAFSVVATFVMVTTLAMALVDAEPEQQVSVVRPARRGVRVRVTR
jgi:hypothetical protein